MSMAYALILALIAFAAAPADSSEAVVVGVNLDNPQRLNEKQQGEILDQLQRAKVNVIRAPLKPPWEGDDYRPAIEFIRRAYARDIKTDLIVQLQFREDAQRRPAVEELPALWPSYPLSGADPTRFRDVFEPLLNQLEDAGIVLAAFELGNEINSPAFNGDFLVVNGQARVFGHDDLRHNPRARDIAAGYRRYLETLVSLKYLRDRSRLNGTTPILSAGLADPGSEGPRPRSKTDAVAIIGTLRYLRENGMDTLVDAYGVHAYPWTETADSRRRQLQTDTLAECYGPNRGKACWITEWGVPANQTACPADDASRVRLIRELLEDFREFISAGRLRGLIYYAWVDNRYGIYRCNALTESGRLALDRSGLE